MEEDTAVEETVAEETAEETPVQAGTVTMRVLRYYPRGGRTYAVGEIADFPVHVAESMEEASPPFGELVDPNQIIDVDATTGALDLAADNGFDLRDRVGEGSGDAGRIYKSDVEQWLQEA